MLEVAGLMGATLGFRIWPPVLGPNGLNPRTSHASLPKSLFPELPGGGQAEVWGLCYWRYWDGPGEP